MKFLITGGAGYIGSHMVKHLLDEGYEVAVLDNLSTGHRLFINNCEHIDVDITNLEDLRNKLKNKKYEAVFHFAGKSIVSESLDMPDYYYLNNVIGTKNLINCMLENGTNYLIYSSSASIFGNTSKIKIDEDSLKNPVSPYGKSKLETEKIIKSYCETKSLNAVCLRYFNAAGAHSSGRIGELRSIETHLIPRIINSILYEKKHFIVFGNDYDTPDGTPIRDYIHVMDLVEGHIKALNYISENKKSITINLGTGKGISVLEVINSYNQFAETKLNYVFKERRPGDAECCFADTSLANELINWSAKRNLEQIWNSIFKWNREYPNGYD